MGQRRYVCSTNHRLGSMKGARDFQLGSTKAAIRRNMFTILSHISTFHCLFVIPVPEDRGGGYVAFGRVLRLWHGDEIDRTHEDFVKWDPTMFDSLKREYGDVDVLIYRTPWPW